MFKSHYSKTHKIPIENPIRSDIMLIVMAEKSIGNIIVGGAETLVGSGGVVYGAVESLSQSLPEDKKAVVVALLGLILAVGGVARFARGLGKENFKTIPQMIGSMIQVEEEDIAAFSENGLKRRPVTRLRHRVAKKLEGPKKSS